MDRTKGGRRVFGDVSNNIITDDQREERNRKQREYRARKRAEETDEQREERNRKQRENYARRKAEQKSTTPGNP